MITKSQLAKPLLSTMKYIINLTRHLKKEQVPEVIIAEITFIGVNSADNKRA